MTTKTIDEIAPDRLLLDLENPRFGLIDAHEEAEALRLLATRANLRELWDSINQRGFERFEPLVAFPAGAGDYIVVEGNRRLAAVKTMLNPQLLEGLKLAPPAVSAVAAATIKTLPVTIIQKRDDADDYIGFKHINGPSTWGSLAKAKFGVKLFEKLPVPPNEADTRIATLSKRLGDSRQLILRSLVAFKVFEQAQSAELLDPAKVDNDLLDFSHLYTILQSPAARRYLGLPDAPLSEALIRDNPVPTSHTEKLAYMMQWLFGAPGLSSIIKSQGVDRPRLIKVLSSPSATETLEKTGNFERAAEEAGFVADNWLDAVVRLATLSKKVADGVTDLPEGLEPDAVSRAKERLIFADRNVKGAMSLLGTLFA